MANSDDTSLEPLDYFSTEGFDGLDEFIVEAMAEDTHKEAHVPQAAMNPIGQQIKENPETGDPPKYGNGQKSRARAQAPQGRAIEKHIRQQTSIGKAVSKTDVAQLPGRKRLRTEEIAVSGGPTSEPLTDFDDTSLEPLDYLSTDGFDGLDAFMANAIAEDARKEANLLQAGMKPIAQQLNEHPDIDKIQPDLLAYLQEAAPDLTHSKPNFTVDDLVKAAIQHGIKGIEALGQLTGMHRYYDYNLNRVDAMFFLSHGIRYIQQASYTACKLLNPNGIHKLDPNDFRHMVLKEKYGPFQLAALSLDLPGLIRVLGDNDNTRQIAVNIVKKPDGSNLLNLVSIILTNDCPKHNRGTDFVLNTAQEPNALTTLLEYVDPQVKSKHYRYERSKDYQYNG